MEINFRHDHKCFNFKVVAVIKKDDQFLISNHEDIYSLPGGRVQFGETTEHAIKRIILDELQLNIQIVKLLSINENFFDYGEDDYHELLFVYLCETIEKNTQQKNVSVHKKVSEKFKYINFKELLRLNFKPDFLISDLKNVSDVITHHINKD